jgi:hypothetical protein
LRNGNLLRSLVLGVAMLVGAHAGVPMSPDEIEEFMSRMSRPKVVHVLREEKED